MPCLGIHNVKYWIKRESIGNKVKVGVTDRMKLAQDYVVKNIVGNMVIIPVGQVLVNGGKNIRLTTEGGFFIKFILQGKTEEQILELYSDLFSVDPEEAKEDYEGFIEYGKNIGFLED